MNNYNHFCPYCLIASKQNLKCGNCGQNTITISHRAKVPKKDAKKKEWKELFDEFPHILIVAPYTKALNEMGFK
jgi:hypothetical protein